MSSSSGNQSLSHGLAPLRTDTLVDSVLILLGLTLVQRLVGFCRAILFCRWLDAEQLGQWDMAFSFLMLAGPLAILSLPAAFGRYVEHYRQRQQIRTLLRRTAILCVCLAVPAVLGIYSARHWFSQLIFGTPQRTELVMILAGSLLGVIALNYFVDLITALRNVRVVAGLQFFQSLIFATLAVCLLLAWRCSASSIVIAYGGACLLCAAGAMWWLRRAWPSFPGEERPLPQRDLWGKVLPFVGWILLASVLANLFEVVDRYMIVHCSAMPASEALARVGDYHSSRVVPLLFVSIVLLLSAMITPHLSHDWEAGRRRRVTFRLNLFLKLLGFALSAATIVVLLAAPLLFGVAFQGKFAGGLAVLPWTLTYCCWFGLTVASQNYLWCAEKARLASLALLIGLAVNVGLNLLLMPRMGLLGAVLATTAANFVALALVCSFNHMLGFRLDGGTRVAIVLPIVACLGPWLALAVLTAVAVEAAGSNRLLSAEEKRQLIDRAREYLERFRKTLGVSAGA